ncbi:hypothetical protein [Streptomyces tremellae]|uniref:4-hydroxythreonine-4-phosphate dehydrogenase n=1 Tax=Streptomyces tremellae TaxID=1124239 RepID=A0ABP7F822_9ACTN
MTEFVFMLTRGDRTVQDAHAVLDAVARVGLRHIGFKDIGLPFAELRVLARRIRELGARAYLEVVSEDAAAELRGVEAAPGLGVDAVLGGTRAVRAAGLLAGTGVEYWPFPGRVEGHPSVLRGPAADIVASARDLAAVPGVHGLDLLAHRFDGDAARLAARVVAAVDVPVLAAGSVDREERVAALRAAGVWGFTAGTAVLDGTFRVPAAPRGTAALLTAVLRSAEGPERAPAGT